MATPFTPPTGNGSSVESVTRDEFLARLEALLALMASVGIEFEVADSATGLLESSPSLAAFGAVEAIDLGIIAPGSRVLIAVTGGCMPKGGSFLPDIAWSEEEGFDELLHRVTS